MAAAHCAGEGADISPAGAARIAVDGHQLPAAAHDKAATSEGPVLELSVQSFVRSEGRYASAPPLPCIAVSLLSRLSR